MKWTENGAKRMLTRNGAVISGNQISMRMPGIKSWGAIDFLTGECGYIFFKA